MHQLDRSARPGIDSSLRNLKISPESLALLTAIRRAFILQATGSPSQIQAAFSSVLDASNVAKSSMRSVKQDAPDTADHATITTPLSPAEGK